MHSGEALEMQVLDIYLEGQSEAFRRRGRGLQLDKQDQKTSKFSDIYAPAFFLVLFIALISLARRNGDLTYSAILILAFVVLLIRGISRQWRR